jgi:hypothetical protein
MSSATTPTGKCQSLPVDILLIILDNLDKSDIVTMCRLNKLCCALAQPILFRDIRIQFDEEIPYKGYRIKYDREITLCVTLSQSPHLARCVRSFSVKVIDGSMRLVTKIVETLEFLPSLRHLGLNVYYGFNHLLSGRTFTFKLESFSFHLPHDTHLRDFLNSQPSLTSVDIRFRERWNFPRELERKCLPNLTRVTTHFTDAEKIICGRPVSEITCIGEYDSKHITLDFFALSTAPIRKLTIDYYLLCFGAKPEQLRALFPSLAHLTLTSLFKFSDMMLVRVSLRIFIRLFKYVIGNPRLW